MSMLIREADLNDAEAIAKVRVDSWRTTYRGLLPQRYLDSLSYEPVAENWRNVLAAGGRQGFVYVAEDEAGQVVGVAMGGPDRTMNPIYTGELYVIYLLEGYQRQGAGRKLVATVARRLVQDGMFSMLVWVLDGNPAQSFYESLGGHAVYRKEVSLAGGKYSEIGYAWEDIRSLAEQVSF
ncbi:MAG TPA: GNAT family N-acetyltransferase [Anaerolineales bacterium]